MCQGKMPITVRQRYENMMIGKPGDLKFKNMIDNFDSASSHPDLVDCDKLNEQVIRVIKNLPDFTQIKENANCYINKQIVIGRYIAKAIQNNFDYYGLLH